MSLPFDAKAYMRDLTDFRADYGTLMETWGKLEDALFYWFLWMTNIDKPLARAIYFSTRTFTARRDLLRSVLPLSKLDEPTKEFVREGVKKAGQFSSFRNRAVHGVPRWNKTTNQHVLADGAWNDDDPLTGAVTKGQIQAAIKNIAELYAVLWDLKRPLGRTYPDGIRPASPQAYLERIRALPTEASASQTPPKPPRTKRQPQKPQA